jgi:tRNA-dihydrouridine synthase
VEPRGGEAAAAPAGAPPYLYLAPLHGVTNRIFRAAYFRRFPGFDAALAPFIAAVRCPPPASAASAAANAAAASPFPAAAKHFKDLLPPADPGVRLTPQLLGNDPDAFLETAAVLAAAGYTEVDWNLGCPYPMVAKKLKGAGLLAHPEKIDRFLDAVCRRLEIGLSLKVRLGWRRADESAVLVPIYNRYPLVRLTLHARVGVQMYAGQVDLDGFAAAAAACRHPVVYNGDIADAAGLAALRRRFPAVAGWMLGRGALADPFLPAAAKGLAPAAAPRAVLAAFHADLYAGYRAVLSGPGHTLDKMKEVWRYLGAGPAFAGRRAALGRLAAAKTFPAYEAAAAAVLAG